METPATHTAAPQPGAQPPRRRLHPVARWLFRIVLGVLILLAVVLMTVSLVLRVPAVQNWLLPIANTQLTKALGGETRIGRIRLDLPDMLVLEDFALRDTFHQPLLAARELSVSTISATWFEFLKAGSQGRSIGFRTVELLDPRLNVYIRRDSVANTDFLFASDPTDTTDGPPLALSFGTIRIENLHFRYIDSTTYEPNLRPPAIDYSDVTLDSLYLESSFDMPRDGVFRAEVEHLRAVERRSGLRIHDLATDMALNLGPDPVRRIGPWRGDRAADSIPSIQFLNTRIVANRNTRLDLDADFRNETFDGLFQEATHPRQYRVEFRKAQLDFADLNHFVPDGIPLRGIVALNGVMTGDYRNLRGTGVRLDYANQTRLHADLRLTDYTTPRIFMRINLHPGSQVDLAEVDTLLTETELPVEAHRLGNTRLEGRFTGFYNDFVADVRATSPLGYVESDINLKLLPDQPMRYSGNLITRGFHLDRLLGQQGVSDHLNFQGRVDGQGVTLAELDARFDFRSLGSRLAGYTLDSLGGNVRMDNGVMEGSIRLSDPEGNFNGRVNINLQENPATYFLVGDVARLNLQHYGLTKDTIRLTSIFNVNLAGDSLENISGYVRLFEINLDKPNGEQRVFRDIVVNSRSNSATRKNLQVVSSVADLSMSGNFSYRQLGRLTQRLGREVNLFLANDTARIHTYYAAKPAETDSVRAEARLRVRNLDPLLSFLGVPLRVSRGAELNADMGFGQTDRAHLDLTAGYISWDSLSARRVDLDINVRKPSAANRLTADGIVTADTLLVPGGLVFTDVEVLPNILNQAARLETRLTADSGRAHIKLAALARYNNGTIDGRILAGSSGIILRDSLWRFDPDNRIEYGTNLLRVENFRLTQGSQSIVVESNVTPQNPGRLTLAARNLSVSQLTSILLPGQPLYGVMNATAIVNQPLAPNARFTVNGNIRRLQYDNVRYGDLFIRSESGTPDEGLRATVSLVRQRNDTLLALRGTYNTRRTGSPLDFRLATYNLPLDLVTPFVRGILYDMSGRLNIASLHVTGPLSAPQVRGTARLDNVRFGVDMFRTYYSLDGELTFNQRDIQLGTVALRDANNNPATLRGSIFHNGFTNIRLDLALRDVRDFLFMNTTARDNEVFYGRAVIRQGTADIRGTFSNLTVNANVRTGAGTSIFIPLSDYTEQNRLPYVVFKTSAQDNVNLQQRLEVEGLNLNLTVDATPDAQLTLVLDERTGDNIRGAGQGTLAININTAGEFRMNGTYEVTRGAYLMNLQGVLRREFNVISPSSIAWSGDPLDADMNILGTYTVNADISRLEATGAGNAASSPTMTRPVEVLLYVKGSLLAPQVSFGLRVPNLASENSLVLSSLLRSIENDPQELNKQVVSLLLNRQFAPQNNFLAGDAGGSTVGSTASELLSSQLNNLLNNAFDGKLRVGLGTNNQFRDVNLNLSASLFNNRLTIERQGAIVGNTNRNVTIGNLRASYRLVPGDSALRTKSNPGMLTVEGFNRENFGFQQSNTVITTSWGGGFFYRKEFENVGMLFGLQRPRAEGKPFALPRDKNGQVDTVGLTFYRSVMGRQVRAANLDDQFRQAREADSAKARALRQQPPQGPAPADSTAVRSRATPSFRPAPARTDTTRRSGPGYLNFRKNR